MLAKIATTLDHISGGRVILGLGAGWHELEHRTYGLKFGSGWADRLAWLDESAGALRTLLDGGTYTSPEGGRYAIDTLRLQPAPAQDRLPLLIGGGGEKKTLRTVAKYADMWNWMVPLRAADRLAAKDEVLRRHCEEVGRDHTEIERTLLCNPIIRDTQREANAFWEWQMAQNLTPMEEAKADPAFWVGTPDQLAESMIAYRDVGFTTFIGEAAMLLDEESITRFITEVKPLVDHT